ncbi:MAG: hypothetical protein ACPGJS_05890 [Flammeovirgaceae bacterium]
MNKKSNTIVENSAERERYCPSFPKASLLFAGLIILMTIQQVRAQHDCKQLIVDHVKRMNAFGLPTGKQVYYMHSTTTLEPNSDKVKAHFALSPKDIEVSIMVSKHFMAYQSSYIEVYQDEAESYTVIHPQKTIICAKKNASASAASKQDFAKSLGKVQQDLLQLTEVSKCETGTWKGKPIQVIELETTKEGQQKYNIKKLIYFYDTTSQSVVKQWIEYVPDHKYKRQIATYHQLDLNYKGQVAKQARSRIFTAKNQLHKSYQGYKLEYQN